MLYETSKLDELPEPKRFQVTPLIKAPLDIVLSKELYDTLNQDDLYTELTQLKWAHTSQRPPQKFMEQIPKEFQQYFKPDGSAQYSIENAHTSLALARAGLAGTIAPRALVKEDISNGTLVRIDLAFELNLNIGAYRLRSRGINTTVQKVITALQETDINEL